MSRSAARRERRWPRISIPQWRPEKSSPGRGGGRSGSKWPAGGRPSRVAGCAAAVAEVRWRGRRRSRRSAPPLHHAPHDPPPQASSGRIIRLAAPRRNPPPSEGWGPSRHLTSGASEQTGGGATGGFGVESGLAAFTCI
jgi:hypothetical protein